MKATVDVIMVLKLNQILKEHGLEYTLHTVGGCSCCGLELKCHGKEENIDDILKIINEYLATKWLIASYQPSHPQILYVSSRFEDMH